tara:strand:- start:1384 stop:2658 length:1275 start_codon:yes stop_codon:yes gene_type:complete
MITDLKKIVKEWAYRVDDGKPNPNNSTHLYHLSEILIENKWPLGVIDELLQNLKEGDEWWTKLSPEQQAQYIKDHPKSQKAQDAKEKEKDDKGEEPKKKEEQKQKFLLNMTNMLIQQSTEESGVGRFNMSKEDLQTYQDYLNDKKPKLPNYDIGEDEVNEVIGVLKSTLGGDYQRMVQRVKRKGDPPKEYSVGEKGQKRFFEAIQHYMSTGGKSSITGQVVPFSETQLDHVVSLDNGGVDGPENWEWMESRFNQFKGALSDEEVMTKIKKDLKKSPEEDELKTLEQSFRKYAKQAQIDFYSNKFKEGGTAGLTEESINNLTSPNLNAVIKGWNENNPEDTEFFIPRYGSTKDRKSGRGSGGRLASKPVLIERLIGQMKASGLDIPSQSETQDIDKDFQVIVDELEKQKGDITKLKQKIKKSKES